MELYLEVIVQTILAFFSIFFVTRLLGRQQISQLSFHEYINGITFGSIAAQLATDLDSHTMQHFAGLILFGILTGGFTLLSLKSRTIRKVILGEPTIIIQKGKILEKNLKRSRYNMDDINLLLRQNDCITPEDVEYAILETNGKLSVIKKPNKKNVTIEDLNITKNPDNLPTELIIGGKLIYENLRSVNLSGKELIKKLSKFGVKRIDEVMYATIDITEKMYVDKFDDNFKNIIDISEDNKGV